MAVIIVKMKGERTRVIRTQCFLLEAYETGTVKDDLHDLCMIDLQGEMEDMIPAMMVVERASMRIMAILDALQDAVDAEGMPINVRDMVMDKIQEDLKKEAADA